MAKKRSIKKYFQQFDLFPHKVGLNYNENGDTYSSNFGIIMSLILIAAFSYLTSRKFISMIKLDNPQITIGS